ncbi:hypothetical protein [Pseudonocardia acaciae]|uniref:hypothetical protein n=1 Tax=Pseudonocardia acaciae TaxID=551276 RepID=UPI00056297CD|nr:hypothetical protein [Pseudonocardia acaciae]
MVLAATILLAGVASPGLASAQPPGPTPLCTVTDSRLAELSGLATDGGDRRWAIVDSGRRVQVFELGADCSVRKVLTAPPDPYDVEDLARAPDGTFWLADTGDNRRARDTVAFITLTPAGAAAVHRMRYPDGPHDAEAVLLGRDGVPLIVTKEPLAPAGVYRPERPITPASKETEPVPLRRVGEVSLPASDTVGGPVGAIGGRTVTGGATTADGRVAALRTYTDAWLFAAPDGDLVAALRGAPVRVPLPGEPQGEAIAFDGRGGLLSGSETRQGARGVLRVVPGAAALVAPASEPTESGGNAVTAPATGSLLSWWPVAAVLALALAAAAVLRRARRR